MSLKNEVTRERVLPTTSNASHVVKRSGEGKRVSRKIRDRGQSGRTAKISKA